jgi:hypothetical protein
MPSESVSTIPFYLSVLYTETQEFLGGMFWSRARNSITAGTSYRNRRPHHRSFAR